MIFDEVTMIDYQAKLRQLLRCQLMALPNGKELYAKAITQLNYCLYNDTPTYAWDRCNRDKSSAIAYCIDWIKSIEGYIFWSEIHFTLERMIMDKGTIWLTSPLPTFIEIDE